MKDIPVFTGCDGIATLILREIPYRREAYVLVRSVFTDLDRCLRECEGFCRAVGAETVYFGGNADFSDFPIYTSLIERQILRSQLPKTTAKAVPTYNETQWAALYNQKFKSVPAARSCQKPVNAYEIHKDGEMIGIGQVEGAQLLSVASLKPGCGAECVCALAALCSGESVHLLCAEQNAPAMKLYDRLGFSLGERKEVWYRKKTLAI